MSLSSPTEPNYLGPSLRCEASVSLNVAPLGASLVPDDSDASTTGEAHRWAPLDGRPTSLL